MGAWQEIVDYTIATNTAEFTINLPETLTKDNFYKFVYTINPNNTTNFSEWGVAPNGISRSNTTSFQSLFGLGSSTAAGRRDDNGFGYSNGLGPGQENGQPGIVMGYIKISENNIYNEFASYDRQSSTNIGNYFVVRTVYSTTFPSGVNSLTYRMNSDSGTTGFTTGSRFQIYKLIAEKVADISVASNTQQVDISNLSIDKDSEYLLVSDFATTTNTNYYLYVNDNTTDSNYYIQQIRGFGSTASASRRNDTLLASTNNNRSLVYSYIKLSNIGAFTAQNYGIMDILSTSNQYRLENNYISSTAENITSITKLNIKSLLANQLGAGSRFMLYKLK